MPVTAKKKPSAGLAKRTPSQILEAALLASGYSARSFARHVLDVDERTVRRWLAGESFGGTPLVVCVAIIDRPRLARVLARAVDALRLARGE